MYHIYIYLYSGPGDGGKGTLLSPGAIAGIVVAGVICLLLLIVALVVILVVWYVSIQCTKVGYGRAHIGRRTSETFERKSKCYAYS